MTVLTINSLKLESLPRNIHKHFPNLQEITIRNASLKSIHEINFKFLNKLLKLDLSNNKIELIERNLLKSNFHLQSIDLSNNNIRYIHESSFDHLTSLKSLNLQGNQCHSSIITDRTLIKSIYQPCFTAIDHLTAELAKSTLEFQIEIQNEKIKNYETKNELLEIIREADEKNRVFVADMNIFMTVLGISIIAIVFYLAWPFYRRKGAETRIEESYEKLDNEKLTTISEGVHKVDDSKQSLEWNYEV